MLFLKPVFPMPSVTVNFQTFTVPKDGVIEVRDALVSDHLRASGWIVPSLEEVGTSEAGVAWAHRIIADAAVAAEAAKVVA